MPTERILVLDDNEALRLEAANTLSNAGYLVESAATTKQAIALAREQTFDLVLADIYLPDENGIDAFTQIRQVLPDVAGIAMTGYSSW